MTQKTNSAPHIEVVMFPQVPLLMRIYTHDGDAQAGYCLITADRVKTSEIIGAPERRVTTLWHIYVDNKYRRQGYAHRLLHAVKQGTDEIVVYAISRISEKLFVSSGFKKRGKDWIWEREKE